MIYIIVGVLVILLIIYIIIYNSIIHLRNKVKQAWSGIDIQLKRRANLIPNLIETVKSYKKYELETINNLTEIRNSFLNSDSQSKKELSKLDKNYQNSIKSIFAVAENYPKLKSNENYIKLQEELANTEDLIAASRRIYNSNTAIYNTKVQTFPNSIIASIHSFREEDFFKNS